MRRDGFFRAFFGMGPASIRRRVVISPVIYPNRLGKVRYRRSVLGYLVVYLRHMTFVKAPMTQAAVSDAVLLLKNTPCREVVFIGAMGGLAKGLKIGDIFRTSRAKEVHSVSSLHAEPRRKMFSLRKRGVVGIDFESRAFFSAARKAKLSATAYYVVTDLPLTKPFYLGNTAREKERIALSLRALAAEINENQAH